MKTEVKVIMLFQTKSVSVSEQLSYVFFFSASSLLAYFEVLYDGQALHGATTSREGEVPVLLEYLSNGGLPVSKILVSNVSYGDLTGKTAGSSVSLVTIVTKL
jgi:hypothetical protein